MARLFASKQDRYNQPNPLGVSYRDTAAERHDEVEHNRLYGTDTLRGNARNLGGFDYPTL